MNNKNPLDELMTQFEEALAESSLSQREQIARMNQFREGAAERMQELADLIDSMPGATKEELLAAFGDVELRKKALDDGFSIYADDDDAIDVSKVIEALRAYPAGTLIKSVSVLPALKPEVAAEAKPHWEKFHGVEAGADWGGKMIKVCTSP